MNKQPLVSVIIPVYNVEEYLPHCLESVIRQSYSNLEILVVDDGSTDSCGAICDSYAKKDKRIHVIHKPNGGLSDARNAALNVMTGDFVTFVDSDDYVSINYVSDLYHLIVRNGADIAVNTFAIVHDHNYMGKGKKSLKIFLLSRMEALQRLFYQAGFDATAPCKMFKKNLFNNIRFPKGLLFEDVPTTYRLFLKAESIVYCDNPSYYYFMRPDSIEGSVFTDKKAQSVIDIIELMNRDKDLFKPVLKSFNCRVASLLFHVYLQMPEDSGYRRVFECKIRSLRFHVMVDKRARMKTRIACLLSYLGFDSVYRIFHMKLSPKIR